MTVSGGRLANISGLVLVNLMWAAQYPAYKVASEHMGPATLNFWTLVLASFLMLPLVLRQRDKHVRPIGNRIKTVRDFVLLGILGILPPSVMLAWGVDHSTSANAAILSTTIPILLAIMAVLLLHEKLTLLRGGSLLLALVGTVLVSRADMAGGSFNPRMLVGNIVIFAACAGSAFYNTYGKRLLEIFSEAEVLLYGYLVAVVACIPLAFLNHEGPLWMVSQYPASVWISIAVLGGLSWGLAMIIWMWVLKRIQASQASVSIYLLPVFGVALSAITLHEKLNRSQVIGGLLVIACTFATTEYEARMTARKNALEIFVD